MQAAVFKGIQNMQIKDIKQPQINDEEVLLKVKACSICGTDRKIYNKGKDKIKENQILGHEISGKIIKVGKNVKYYKKNMRVTLAPNLGCGYCSICRQGLEQLCPDYKAFGIGLDGGFSEYMKISAPALRRGNVVEIPEQMSYEEAALIEPLACCYNAYEKLGIKPGESLLIFGAGIMGNFHLLLNKSLGTGMIIMVDIDQDRLEFSKKLGADYIFINDKNLIDEILELTDKKGVDNIVTAAPVAQIQKQALDLVSINGKINFFAGLAEEEKIPVNTNKLHYKQQILTGTTGSTVQQFRKTLKIVNKTGINLKKMITRHISLEELPEVMADKDIFKKNMKIQVQF
ncbi:MAG: alcohol dehydrogenase catalytic domain-containing protein [Halanaerobiales bacterium]